MHTPLRQTGAIRWTASVALALTLLAVLWLVSVLDDAWCLRAMSPSRGCGLLPGWARDLLLFVAWASCVWAAGHALVSMILSIRQRRLGE